MNLERSIGNLAKRLDRLNPVFAPDDDFGLNHWKGKPIIPLDEWIQIRNTSYALDYFPDDFNQDFTYIPEDETGLKQKDMTRWGSDYQELMEYTKNPNYGRFKCFHCLLSPDADDPIFIGINRLIAKGLCNGKQERDGIEYPRQVVNRFQCPYNGMNIKEGHNIEGTSSNFDVEDLFKLQRMAFMVEISMARARKENSKFQIRDKQDLLDANRQRYFHQDTTAG